ncbi:MAG: cation transporter [Betaproteobacteria bacterium]
MESLEVGIDGMSCQGCVKNITGLLLALPGVERVEVSLEAKQASIAFDPDKVGLSQFRQTIEAAGFDVL